MTRCALATTARTRTDAAIPVCARAVSSGSRAAKEAILKYVDNIARVYAHAIAMMVTMGVSVQLFHAPITPQLVLAVVLVATSTLQYNLPKELLRDDDEERRKLIEADEGPSDTELAPAAGAGKKPLLPTAGARA